MLQLDLNVHYTYADYITWQFDEMIELIKDKISLMYPVLNVKHQRISWKISGALFNYFAQKTVRILLLPLTYIYTIAKNCY